MSLVNAHAGTELKGPIRLCALTPLQDTVRDYMVVHSKRGVIIDVHAWPNSTASWESGSAKQDICAESGESLFILITKGYGSFKATTKPLVRHLPPNNAFAVAWGRWWWSSRVRRDYLRRLARQSKAG